METFRDILTPKGCTNCICFSQVLFSGGMNVMYGRPYKLERSMIILPQTAGILMVRLRPLPCSKVPPPPVGRQLVCRHRAAIQMAACHPPPPGSSFHKPGQRDNVSRIEILDSGLSTHYSVLLRSRDQPPFYRDAKFENRIHPAVSGLVVLSTTLSRHKM